MYMHDADDPAVAPQVTDSSNTYWNETNIALLVTGFCVGSLAGLSASPVISGIITAVVASAAAIVAAAAGLQAIVRSRLNAVPLAFFVVALLLGACFGLVLRINNALGIDPVDQDIASWKKRGIDEDLVVRRAFLQAYPPSAGEFPLPSDVIDAQLQAWAKVGITDTSAIGQHLLSLTPVAASTARLADGTGLNLALTALMTGETADSCRALFQALRANNNNYRDAFAKVGVERWRALSVITDTVALKEIYEKDLCQYR